MTPMLKFPHSFHIPVMGTSFTVDTPLKVARYGISSVISILDDRLLEELREYHCHRLGEAYLPIDRTEPDARARRVTAYLNLVHRIVNKQIEEVKNSPFQPGSEITRYFEMLDDVSEDKKRYVRMLEEPNPDVRKDLERDLRERVVPGSIDVNIM